METRRVRIPEHVEFNQVDGDYVLLDLRRGTYYGLDRVASVIWRGLSDHGDPQRALEDVLARFHVDESKARGDLDSLLRDLESQGLLTTERSK